MQIDAVSFVVEDRQDENWQNPAVNRFVMVPEGKRGVEGSEIELIGEGILVKDGNKWCFMKHKCLPNRYSQHWGS